jgi:putative transposase
VARPLRIEYEGAVYHVTGRGNEQRKIFFSRRDYEKFKEYLADAVEKYSLILHGYVLMTNHYHLIIETPEKNLSKIMHHINSSYTTYININRKRSGHLMQGRFKSIVVEKDCYLLELSRYLHLNPVRANMTQLPEDYRNSSYGAYTTAGAENLVSTKTILEMLDLKPDVARKKYKSFVESALEQGLESPLNKVYGGIILGSVDFIKDALGRIEDERLQKEETLTSIAAARRNRFGNLCLLWAITGRIREYRAERNQEDVHVPSEKAYECRKPRDRRAIRGYGCSYGSQGAPEVFKRTCG